MQKSEGGRLQRVVQAVASGSNRFRDTNSRYWRFVTAGNAGGTVAMLSLIGTAWGSSGGEPVPSEMVVILYIYIAGLAGSLSALLVDIPLVRREADVFAEMREGELPSRKDQFGLTVELACWGIAMSFSAVALNVATLWGMIYLWQLTG